MMNTALPWAYQAVVHFARMSKNSVGDAAARAAKSSGGVSTHHNHNNHHSGLLPNLLLSEQSSRAQRAVWLLHRPGGVLGLVVRPQRDVDCGSAKPTWKYVDASRSTLSLSSRRVVRHLSSFPFSVTGDGPVRSPVVLHKNHLIGWCLNGCAAPLYAHSIDELARLKPQRLKTLSPSNAFLCTNYFEWDNWKEVSMEPGWTWHYADEHVANRLVGGHISFDELHGVTAEVQ